MFPLPKCCFFLYANFCFLQYVIKETFFLYYLTEFLFSALSCSWKHNALLGYLSQWGALWLQCTKNSLKLKANKQTGFTLKKTMENSYYYKRASLQKRYVPCSLPNFPLPFLLSKKNSTVLCFPDWWPCYHNDSFFSTIIKCYKQVT